MNLKQFKLTNGEEILCEVVEWPDETHSEILARNVIQIVTKETTMVENPGYGRYYVLRPWMMYVDGYKEIVMINPNSVLGTATPAADTLEQYCHGILKMQEINDERTLAAAMNAAESAEREVESLSNFLDNLASPERTKTATDSADNNVIAFPSGADKVH